ncbi:MAG: class I SAM-dependent methyltransferase [Thermoflexus sp.]|uniref:class I SAM-dependent methyltransferase n=1 Tax=Thermoflexus sp. TaxID=1969742 RepID=UPI0025EFFB64|nr:class I SAM-dependent methyltransferase [Thermoflexus sp.]MCS6963473.1 class I SAM-dependent methyltransferase [Thermoflexus sp.]
MGKLASHPWAKFYDAYYFAHCCGRPYERSEEWLRFFGSIADRIVRDIQPRTVLDAGCAMGFLVEALRDRGVEAYGIDISKYAIERVRPDIREYCWVASVTEELDRWYDLIVCIEVLEHLTAREAEQAVANFCNHTDDILFSSTPFDYKEATHLNVQPPEYWAEAFARHGFFRDVDFDASFITPWAMRLRRCREPMHRIVRHYERRYWTLWQENLELRALALELRERVAAQEQEIHRLRSLEDQASPRNNLGACKVLRGIVRWLRGRGK